MQAVVGELVDRGQSRSGGQVTDSSGESSTGGFGKTGQVGREQRIVEVDGRLVPARTALLDRSALVVGRQRRTVTPLELLELASGCGATSVTGVHVSHGLALGRGRQFVQDPCDKAVKRIL